MAFPNRLYQVPVQAQEKAALSHYGVVIGFINKYFAHPRGLVWHNITGDENPCQWLKRNVFDNDPGEGPGVHNPRNLRADAGILGNRLIVSYGISQGYVMRSLEEKIPAESDLPRRIAHGLSRKYDFAECESGVTGLIRCDPEVPDFSELFQGDTVWIAVTYKHDILSKDGDTFTNQHLCQALRSVWENGFAAGHTYVRLWCDQILRERLKGKVRLDSKEWFSYGTYPYAALPVVTALGPHSRGVFTTKVKSSVWLSLEERLGASCAGIDLGPGLGRDYILNLIADRPECLKALHSDFTRGVVWGKIPSAKTIAYSTASILLMYTGPIDSYWRESHLELIKWALSTAARGVHNIIGQEEGDQELSNTEDHIIDTLKNIDYNTDTNAFNVPWSRQETGRCYGGILDHLPSVRHIFTEAEKEQYIALAEKHYRVTNIDQEILKRAGMEEGVKIDVFVSVYHNSVLLYLVGFRPIRSFGHIIEIVNLKTINLRLHDVSSFAQDRTTPLASRNENLVRRILINSMVLFCNSPTTSVTAKCLRLVLVHDDHPNLEQANGAKTWWGASVSLQGHPNLECSMM